MACCVLCNVLVSITRLPNGLLARSPFGGLVNRTKYIRHRTTSHLTADISDLPNYSRIVSSRDGLVDTMLKGTSK